MSFDLFNPPEAVKLARAGASLAADYADRVHDGWTEQATAFLMQVARERDTFQASDVREAAEGKVPPAPDDRAWGHILSLAKRNKWIEPLGYRPTNRKKSHGRQEQTWRIAA